MAQISDMTLLGRLAFRNEAFMDQAMNFQWKGDSIAINKWKDEFKKFLFLRSYYPPHLLGLSHKRKGVFSTITYQFYHEGFLHLLGNILLLLIIGGYLEKRYSGLNVLGVYLLGGCLGAYLFSYLGYLSGSPLIGASGSICALLGFLFVLEFHSKTRLFYMILPSRSYMGFVYIPTAYWVIGLCTLEDLSGWLAHPSAFAGGIAHAIHLLGFLVGTGLALISQKVLGINTSNELQGGCSQEKSNEGLANPKSNWFFSRTVRWERVSRVSAKSL